MDDSPPDTPPRMESPRYDDVSPTSTSPVRSPSGAEWDEQRILASVYEGDEDLDLWSANFDTAALMEAILKRELIREVLKEHISYFTNLKNLASSRTEAVKKSILEGRKSISRDNVRRVLITKKKEMERNMQNPPFIKTSDKLAFTFGMVVLLVSELILLEYPSFFYQWYVLLLFPLLTARFFMYEKSKYHYFMLDYCYFAQFMLMVYIYAVPYNHIWFQVVFCATNGPLLSGIVMWRNSLVFHDLDKLTSVFIHLFPALTTFATRWYPSEGFEVCSQRGGECDMNYGIVCVLTIFIYLVWQFFYLFKTEIVDGRKLRNDKAIMTSARWMSQVKPHPIWQYFRKRGAKESHAIPVLVAVQLLYTIAAILPTLFIFHSFLLHSLYISGISLVCIWNGANFYFDVFSETYTMRLKRSLDHSKDKEEGTSGNKKKEAEANQEAERGQTASASS